jgi:azurin
MKTRLLLVSLFASLFVAGCGKKEPAAAAPAAGTPAAATPAPAPAAAKTAGATVIEIEANDTMKFLSGGKESGPAAGLALEAPAGGEIKLVLINKGAAPKEAMGHNLVVLKPGSDPMAFAVAAMVAKDKEYIPDALKDQVIAHTAMLGPRQKEELILKGLAAGVYPFVCSFPGHAQVGMKGMLTIK